VVVHGTRDTGHGTRDTGHGTRDTGHGAREKLCRELPNVNCCALFACGNRLRLGAGPKPSYCVDTFFENANWRAAGASLYSVTGCPPIFQKMPCLFDRRPAFWAGVEKSPCYRKEPFRALFKVVPIAGRSLDSMRKSTALCSR